MVTMVLLIFAAMCPKNAFPFCFDRAGQTYGVPPQLIEAIACYRSGKPLTALSKPVEMDVMRYIERLKVYFDSF